MFSRPATNPVRPGLTWSLVVKGNALTSPTYLCLVSHTKVCYRVKGNQRQLRASDFQLNDLNDTQGVAIKHRDSNDNNVMSFLEFYILFV